MNNRNLSIIQTINRLYLAGRGVTTNEAFKWELVEDSIDRGELWVEDDVQTDDGDDDKNSSTKQKGTGGKNKKKTRFQSTKRKIESLDELDNIYDKGFLKNLYDVFFPPTLHYVKKNKSA